MMKGVLSFIWDAFRGDSYAATTIPITLIRRPGGGWMATYDAYLFSRGREVYYFATGDSSREAKNRLVLILQEAIDETYHATPFEHEEIIHG